MQCLLMLSPQIKGKGLHLQFIKHNFTFASSTLEINSSLDYLCLFICKGSHFCHQGQIKPPNEECPRQLFLNMFASESHYIKERYHPACTHTRKEKEKKNKTNKQTFSFPVQTAHSAKGMSAKNIDCIAAI